MRKLAIAVALSSTVLATPALARDGAWYIGGDFGAMIVEDVEFDIGTTQSALSMDHEYGYDADAFVGYDFGAFRVEGEVSYKKADVDAIERNPSFGLPLPGQSIAGRTTGNVPQFAEAGGSTTSLSFMANAMLDFGDDEGISGFVGGGAGIARVKFNNQRVFSNAAPFFDESDSRFAWQAIAGVRQAITDNIEMQVKYRFFNVDNLRFTAFNGGETETRLRTHSLLGGIVFNFGGAEPPPPPPLPTPAPAPAPAPEPMPEPAPVQQPVPQGPFIVFFDWDRADITPQAAAILDNAAAAYQQTGQAQVVLAGHADRSGSAQYNVGLSQRRADAVRSYMAGRGVPDGAMRTEAFGESRPLVETADGVREPQNRRVEITFGPGAGM